MNKSLKRAYEKGFFDDSKFEYIRKLRKLRRHPERDSVSSHYGSDSSFDIKEELPRRGFMKKKQQEEEDMLSNSISPEHQPKRKTRVSKPKTSRKVSKPK